MIGELLEVCAAAIIRPHREPGCRRVFLLRREEVPGQVCFTFPGGGQELGESRQSCIVREVGEELGYHGRFRLRLICSHIGEGVPGQQVNLHLFLLQLGENLDTIGGRLTMTTTALPG